MLEGLGKEPGAHVLDRCEAAYGQARQKNVNVAQAYVCELSRSTVELGPVAELCVELRTECLPLRGLGGSQPRSGESLVAFHERRVCPCCLQGPETVAHFLSDCDKDQQRAALLTVLADVDNAKVQQLFAMQDENEIWHDLLDPCFWDSACEAAYPARNMRVCDVDGQNVR